MSQDSFAHLPLFEGLSAAQIDILRPFFSLCQEEADVVIFEQGAPAENLYIVIEGEMSIAYKPEDGPAIVLSRVRANGVVGWSAALGTPAYTAAAICVTDCMLLCVRGRDLRMLCEQYSDIGQTLLERLAAVVGERKQHAHPQVMALLGIGLRVNGGTEHHF